MKRLILLSLVLVLAACVTDPVTPPPENGDGNGGGEPQLCDDGSHSDIVLAKPIEFGKAYQVRTGLSYFRARTDRPITVTLRLDNLPNYGFIDYRVLDAEQNAVIVGNFSDRDGPIPRSALFTGQIEQPGAVFVRLNHAVGLGETRCATFQFLLTKG